MTGGEPPAGDVVEVLRQAAAAVAAVLEHQEDWGLTGAGHHQYHHDTAADAAALSVLGPAGFGVFSEESGMHDADRPVLVVLDPVDGSTNVSRGLPWWAISLCALDSDGPLAAVVAGPRTGDHFEAVRGGGARRNGLSISPSQATELGESIVAFNGHPASNYGWAQFRALGAAALDLCAVACGAVDGFVDCSGPALAPWDYLGGLLICQEAGASVSELYGRELVVRRPGTRRSLVAAATPELLAKLIEARQA